MHFSIRFDYHQTHVYIKKKKSFSINKNEDHLKYSENQKTGGAICFTSLAVNNTK